MPTTPPASTPPLTLRYVMDLRRYMSLAIGLFLTAVIVVVIGIWPQIQASMDLWNEWQTNQKKVASLAAKDRQLSDILDPALLAQSETVDTLLPSKKPLLELLTAMNSLGTQSGVTFASVELSPGAIATDSGTIRRGQVRKGDSDVLEVNLTIRGTLAQINQFFSAIERTTPLTTITSLSLNPIATRQTLAATDTAATLAPQAYEAELVLTASYFTKSVSANVDAALPQLTPQQTALLAQLEDFTVYRIDPQTQVLGGGLQDLFKVLDPEITTVTE